ncbi:calcium-binding protein [Salipiger marinus]|uniref:calcium-binding protein n=1 Tax=Salipiger marinus TaxID=555512 RepID=UPI0022A965FB|nr:hypothetical protein [Salipiger manganoxidans]
MALVTLSSPTEGLNMLDPAQLGFDAQDPNGTNSATRYSWITPDGHDIQANGTGISWSSPAGTPLTGTVTSLSVDFDDNNNTDFTVTGFSASLVEMTTGNNLLGAVFGGNDTINGSDFGDTLKGVAGDDRIFAGNGNDDVYGGIGNDSLDGGAGADTLRGEAGNDTLIGGSGADSLSGGEGNDLLIDDGLNVDTLDGGAGNDTVRATSELAAANATWRGGSGIDWFDASDISNDGREIDLFNGRWELTQNSLTFEELTGFENVDGGSGSEYIRGSNDANFLLGNGGNDTLQGVGGTPGVAADTLNGGAGDDSILGSDGNDLIRGDAGADHLSGGQGNDRFVYNPGAFGADSVFGNLGSDTIVLSGAGSFDFRTEGVQLSQLEEIEFGAGGQTLLISADEINDGFAEGLLVDGFSTAGNAENLRIQMDGDIQLDMSGWVFQDWSEAEDQIFVTGDASSETITGSTVDDSVSMGDGNDTFRLTTPAHAGADTVTGGAGSDRVQLMGTGVFDLSATEFNTIEEIEFGTSGVASVILTSDEIDTAAELQTVLIDGFDGSSSTNAITVVMNTTNLSLAGWTFQDWDNLESEVITLIGTSVSNTITGSVERDSVSGGDGDDSIATGLDHDTIAGDDGNDTIDAGEGDDLVSGGLGDDSLTGGLGNDTVDYSGETVGFSADLAAGTTIFPALFTEDVLEFENLLGGSGNDTVFGTAGANLLQGRNGNDSLNGRGGNDTLQGGNGQDTLQGGDGNDSLTGDAASDRLFGNVGNDTLGGGEGSDRLFGENGQDVLRGDAGNDTLDGGGGNDVLVGGQGNDVLFGRGGADTLTGGGGNDLLVGESGADVFVFAGSWGQDRIQGFEAGNLEKIDLSAITNITDFADLLANHLRDNGGSAEIFFNANTILLEGISVSEIGVGLAYSADDFIF